MGALKIVNWLAATLLACTLSQAQDNAPAKQASLLHNVYVGIIKERLGPAEMFLVDIGLKDPVVMPFADTLTVIFSKNLIVIRPTPAALYETDREDYQIMKVGQKVLVQVYRDATPLALPRVTSNLSLDTEGLLLLHPFAGVATFKRSSQRLQMWAKGVVMPEGCGLIVRTNAAPLTIKELDDQLAALKKRYEKITQEMEAAQGPALLDP